MKQHVLNAVKRLQLVNYNIIFTNIILQMKTKNTTALFVTGDSLINMHEMIILMFTQVKGRISVNIARQHLRVRALWARIKEPIWA